MALTPQKARHLLDAFKQQNIHARMDGDGGVLLEGELLAQLETAKKQAGVRMSDLIEANALVVVSKPSTPLEPPPLESLHLLQLPPESLVTDRTAHKACAVEDRQWSRLQGHALLKRSMELGREAAAQGNLWLDLGEIKRMADRDTSNSLGGRSR